MLSEETDQLHRMRECEWTLDAISLFFSIQYQTDQSMLYEERKRIEQMNKQRSIYREGEFSFWLAWTWTTWEYDHILYLVCIYTSITFTLSLITMLVFYSLYLSEDNHSYFFFDTRVKASSNIKSTWSVIDGFDMCEKCRWKIIQNEEKKR